MPEHDEFNCACHETCSWCTTPTLLKRLRETNDGALICPQCRKDNPTVTTRKVDL
jgi:uncharacterized Zn finger protein (UPF0148 family)